MGMFEKLSGNEKYYSMNGSYGTWYAISVLIDNGDIGSLQELRHIAGEQMSSIHAKMKHMEDVVE